MIFTSVEFLIFFPVVVGLYFFLPHRLRWILLLVASYYFYMAWKPQYALLLLASTLSFYFAALLLDNTTSESRRKAIFACGIGLNIGFLFAFKYYNFFQSQSAAWLQRHDMGWHLPALDVLLPMGISFYTFQGISYLTDVYRRSMPAERHVGILMLYKAFFPQLVAGPIERGTHFIPQLRALLLEQRGYGPRFEYARVVSGLRLMLLGFFKKIVLADNFAQIVQPVYAAPEEYSGISAMVATIAFAFQIFFDFSAYTDIARGAARVLGFELIENFDRPYFSTSIGDFWRRWHISLSSWFRDYLYIPLGGNRVPQWRRFANLWIVFLLCGLWHGANWTFLLWGALHGFYFVLTDLCTNPARWLATHTWIRHFPRLHRAVLVFVTFFLVCWAWVLFRAESVAGAIAIWSSILSIPPQVAGVIRMVAVEHVHLSALEATGLGWLARPSGKLSLMPVYIALLTTAYMIASYRVRAGDDGIAFAEFGRSVRWGSYFLALLCIALLGRFTAAPFIYFQF